jgi:hypothetical protein
MSTPKTAVELVKAIRSSLPESHEWDEREAGLLELAARQAADLDALEADIAKVGVRTESGRLNQAFCEARQARVALARILGQVDVPEATSPRSLHGRKAAEARWHGRGQDAEVA